MLKIDIWSCQPSFLQKQDISNNKDEEKCVFILVSVNTDTLPD